MRRRRRRRRTRDICLPRARAGQKGTCSPNRFAIVERQHNSDHAQVARQLGQDIFLYLESNPDQSRKGERNDKKTDRLRDTAFEEGTS